MKEANRETENYANYVAPESLQWHNKGKWTIKTPQANSL